MRLGSFGVLLALTCCSAAAAPRPADSLAASGVGAAPPAAVPSPVTETLWGQQVTDPYRAMEALDPATKDWMLAQGRYTDKVFAAIKPRAALLARIVRFTSSFGIAEGFASYGGRDFYQERAPGSDNYDLMTRDAGGARKLVDMGAVRAAQGGTPMAINFFLASPDGARVAVGISAGGSEDASITVYDAVSGAQIAGPVDRGEFGASAWSGDGKALYFVRLKALAPGQSDIEKYKDSTLDRWDLNGEPVPILGSTVGHGPAFSAVEQPTLQLAPGASMAAAVSINGVQNELAVWLTPVTRLEDTQADWQPFVTRADDVNSFDMRGDEIFLVSHRDAPTFQVLSVRAGQALSTATVLLPARPDRVIDSVHAAADGLYVLTRTGAYSQLLRIPTGKTMAEEIALPFKGHIDEAFTDPRMAGVAIALESWVIAPMELRYDPAARVFKDLALTRKPAINPADFTVQDFQARAQDGVMVPDSLVQPKGVPGAADHPDRGLWLVRDLAAGRIQHAGGCVS